MKVEKEYWPYIVLGAHGYRRYRTLYGLRMEVRQTGGKCKMYNSRTDRFEEFNPWKV